MCVCAMCVCVPSALGWSLLLSGLVKNHPHSSRLSLSLFSKSVALPAARGTELNYSWMQHIKKSSPFHIQVFHSCILVLLSHFMPGTMEYRLSLIVYSLFTSTICF